VAERFLGIGDRGAMLAQQDPLRFLFF